MSYFVRYFSGIPAHIIILLLAVMISDMSSIMAFSTLSSFLTVNCGFDILSMNALDSFFYFISLGSKCIFGLLSDYSRKKINWVLIGYLGILFSRALSSGAHIAIADISKIGYMLVVAKFLERFFNGLQGSVRDSYISNSVPDNYRIKCFMLKQSAGSMGCVVGSIINVLILKYSALNHSLVLNVALCLSFFATCILVIAIKYGKSRGLLKSAEAMDSVRRKPSLRDFDVLKSLKSLYVILTRLGVRFWLATVIAFFFYIAQISDFTIKSYFDGNVHFDAMYRKEYLSPLIFVLIHFFTSLFATPVAIFTEKMKNKYIVFMWFIVVFIICDIILLFMKSSIFMVLLFGPIMVGTLTISFGLLQACAIDAVPSNIRGAAIGIFQCLCAFACSISGVFRGVMKSLYGPDVNIFFINILWNCITLCVVLVICYIGRSLKDSRDAN